MGNSENRLKFLSKNLETSTEPILSNQKLGILKYCYIEDLIPSIYPSLLILEPIIRGNKHIKWLSKRHKNLMRAWKIIRSGLSEVEVQFSDYCKIEWNILNSMQDGLICAHTLAVVTVVYLNPDFKYLDNHDKSVLLLSCFFHDIAKRSHPVLKGKDPLHPFTSAGKTLQIFNRLGWIYHSECVEEVVSFINQSYFIKGKKEFMDNSRLPQIIHKLLFVTGIIENENCDIGSYENLSKSIDKTRLYAYEIIILVLFHQSIDFDPDFPNFTPISETQIKKFTSPRIITLAKILFYADFGSYCLPYPILFWTHPKRIEKRYQHVLQLFQ